MRILIVIVSLILSQVLFSQEQYSKRIIIDSISESVYVLRNDYGGNIGVLTGDDGILLIDSHREDFIDSLQQKISKISSLPVKYLINTHWHFDHIENNETLALQGTIIISHENCRARLSEDQVIPIFLPRQVALPQNGLPKITFSDSMSIFINDETVNVIHLKNAHTNSDAIVCFRESNTVHMGDIFVLYGMPFIDVLNGGSLNGMIAACEFVLANTDEKTKIIPGHGSVARKQDLANYTDMLKTIRTRIAQGIETGYNLEGIIDSNPAEEFNSVIDKASLIELYYKSLVEK